MMLFPSIMELMEKAGSRYSLVIATAKRARKLEEAESGDIDSARGITKAAEEIADGTILVLNADEESEE